MNPPLPIPGGEYTHRTGRFFFAIRTFIKPSQTQKVDNILNLTTFLDSDMLTTFLLVGTIKGLAFCVLKFLDDNNAYKKFHHIRIFSKEFFS
jgi:hypothetical protein